MMMEWFVPGLFWFCYVGWSAAELHRLMGCFIRYRGIKLVIAWSAVFLLWPFTLPLLVDSLKRTW